MPYRNYEIKTKKQTVTVKEYIKTDEEIQETNNLNRIIELRQLIADKKLLDEPCMTEQNELRTLLGL